jgi:hypothetical protein
VAFWLLEANWKSFQYAYRARIEEIEKAFREDSFDGIVPLQAYARWYEGWQQRRIGGVLRMPIVAFPHAATAVVGVLLYALLG